MEVIHNLGLHIAGMVGADHMDHHIADTEVAVVDIDSVGIPKVVLNYNTVITVPTHMDHRLTTHHITLINHTIIHRHIEANLRNFLLSHHKDSSMT